MIDVAERITAAVPTTCNRATGGGTSRYLEYLPVSLFGAVMGLSGLSVAWQLVAERYLVPHWVPDAIGAVAVAAFVVLSLAYLVKLVTAPDAVRAEFEHPIAGNLFGTAIISLLLLPIVIAPRALLVAQIMWAAGAVAMLGFAWLMIDRWMSERQQVAHATPAWIVPVVGVLDVPLALPGLGLPPLHGLMVACVAIGLFFAVPLFTLILSRLLFEAPLPGALHPMLLILVAPFAVGFSAYYATTGSIDLFAEALFALTLFMLAVLLGRLRNLVGSCPFKVSWWAVSFPLAASATAAIRFDGTNPGLATDLIAAGVLALASIVIAGLALRTLIGLARGELRNLST
ncbi:MULTISPECIES: SLAC1 anion channel family protein [Sphingosinicellaceae]|uniref:SLAC1 anion channel family protein n=1 Tax=Sphingosinicellaceae TaxID=2820280 RepID=UPI001C1E208D|nr:MULTISPECIES: SLAC1 anion channel family protein [Polymorphobacter]QYE33405.1 SLAC1 anion channel family protein [Polymorphobacter sp. PAMC 29334]UAJ12535.1 SLAC1 anion channel family protein [Polymorphobacter megasporae]